MEKIFIEPTRTTPEVKFSPEESVFELRGRSSPENAIQFYQTILDNLEKFGQSAEDALTVNMAFEYFNTSSSKCLFDVFKKLSNLESRGKDVTINWYYEEGDDDMMEAGEDYSDLLDLEFNFHELEEDF